MFDNLIKGPEPEERRFKVLRVTPELFFEGTAFNTRLSEDGRCVLATEWVGVPKDARVQAVLFDVWNRWVMVRLWSKEFPVVADGGDAPFLEAECRRKVYLLSGSTVPKGEVDGVVTGVVKELRWKEAVGTPVPPAEEAGDEVNTQEIPLSWKTIKEAPFPLPPPPIPEDLRTARAEWVGEDEPCRPPRGGFF